MNCKKCGQEMPEGTKVCPECGHKHGVKAWLIIAIIAVALLLVLGIGILVLVIGGGAIAAILFMKPVEANKVERPVATAGVDNGMYASYLEEYDAYILPNSNTAYLGYQDVKDLDDSALFLATQEIHARYGIAFSDPDVQAYFSARSWYTPGGSGELNQFEAANTLLLQTTLTLRQNPASSSDNPYIRLYSEDPDSYICPNSDTRFLSADDLKDLSGDALCAARYEIFARLGCIFEDTQLQAYFYTKSWYLPTHTQNAFLVDNLGVYETNNITLIELYEKKQAGVNFSADNPYAAFYDANRDYIFPESNTRELWDGDLFALSADECCLARNEIMARRGYTFTDAFLLEYFLQFDWYLPTTPAGNAESIQLSAIEEKNAQTLKQLQTLLDQIPDLSSVNTSLSYTVAGPGFSLQAPQYWKDQASISVTETGVRFVERFSMDTSGGHLFTLTLYKDTDFTNAPSYDLVGYLDDSEGNRLYLVAHYPTDVQFCVAAQALYIQMSNEISSVLDTITGIDGYTFTLAEKEAV